MMHGYQRKRIDIFLDPESDPLGAGYHIAQSKIAIGSGGIWGKGFLHGSQSHLDYLARRPHRLRLRDHGRGMGPGRRRFADHRLRAGHSLGHEGRANAADRFAQLTAAGLSATIFFYVRST